MPNILRHVWQKSCVVFFIISALSFTLSNNHCRHCVGKGVLPGLTLRCVSSKFRCAIGRVRFSLMILQYPQGKSLSLLLFWLAVWLFLLWWLLEDWLPDDPPLGELLLECLPDNPPCLWFDCLLLFPAINATYDLCVSSARTPCSRRSCLFFSIHSLIVLY